MEKWVDAVTGIKGTKMFLEVEIGDSLVTKGEGVCVCVGGGILYIILHPAFHSGA